MGDWRLFFLYRDRLRKVTLADVQRVAEQYLKPANRVLGEFVPTERPERAEIPPTPDLQAALAGYKGGADGAPGRGLRPLAAEHRDAAIVEKNSVQRHPVALLPKQTRGGRVVATLTLHWGDEKSLIEPRDGVQLRRRDARCAARSKRNRAELKEAFERAERQRLDRRRRREHRGARREPDRRRCAWSPRRCASRRSRARSSRR